MALQPDPTEDGFNSFASLEAADEYFEQTYWPSGENPWISFNPEEQEALLITASRRLSALPWLGVPLAEGQLLAFPRSYTSFEYGGVTEVASSTVPSWLVAITCEYARYLWEETVRPLGDFEMGSIKSVSIAGAVSVTFRDGVTTLPSSVDSILRTLSAGTIDLRTGARSMRIVY